MGQDGRMVTATAMFDSGADTSYITSSLVEKVKPEYLTSKYMSYAAFGGSRPSSSAVHNVFRVELQNRKGGSEFMNAVEVENICAPLVRPKVSSEILKSVLDSGLEMADQYDEVGKLVHIDILIGLDYYWSLMKQDVKKLAEGMVVQFRSSDGYFLVHVCGM